MNNENQIIKRKIMLNFLKINLNKGAFTNNVTYPHLLIL